MRQTNRVEVPTTMPIWRLPPAGIAAGLAVTCVAAYHWALQLDLVPISEFKRVLLLGGDGTAHWFLVLSLSAAVVILPFNHPSSRWLTLVAQGFFLWGVIADSRSGSETWEGLISELGAEKLENATAMTQHDVVMCYLWYLIVPHCLCAVIVSAFILSNSAKSYYNATTLNLIRR